MPPPPPPTKKPEIPPAVVAPPPERPEPAPDWGLTTLVALMVPATIAAAAATLDGLRVEVGAIRPADAAGEKDRAGVAAALDDVYSKRLIRAADVNYTVPSLLYLALVIAAAFLVAYPPLVGLTANGRNVGLLSGLGAMVALGILIVIGLSQPYSQPLSIAPTAFRHALEQFSQING